MLVQRTGIADGRIIAFRPANTEVDFYLLPKITTNIQQRSVAMRIEAE
jgi:hypothetical protein